MMLPQLDAHIHELRDLMRDRLRIRGNSFDAQVRKAGRLLPRGIRAHATTLIEARRLAQNPKLARQIDQAGITGAHAAIRDHLMTIDPRERRKDRILGILGILAFNFLLLGAAFVTWLVWTDRV